LGFAGRLKGFVVEGVVGKGDIYRERDRERLSEVKKGGFIPFHVRFRLLFGFGSLGLSMAFSNRITFGSGLKLFSDF
jgi:hypothetical protein